MNTKSLVYLFQINLKSSSQNQLMSIKKIMKLNYDLLYRYKLVYRVVESADI